MTQVVKCLPSKHKALNSNPSTATKKILNEKKKVLILLRLLSKKTCEN
jgi:hypothetical protein